MSSDRFENLEPGVVIDEFAYLTTGEGELLVRGNMDFSVTNLKPDEPYIVSINYRPMYVNPDEPQYEQITVRRDPDA